MMSAITREPSARRGLLPPAARRCIAGLVTAGLVMPSVAWAQCVPKQYGDEIQEIRDAEIERLLNDYAQPIFRVANLGSQRIAMRIINHDSFNAFVVDGRNVFINTGTLMQAKTPNEVIGVIAHETGHIHGGHLAQLRSRIARDQTKSLLLTILGIGLMVGGAAAGGDTAREVGSLGQGVLLGGNEMLMRSLLSERRAQESAADQAGLSFLEATKQSGRGMLETFERFAQQEYVSDAYKDPFVRSHPIAADRLAQLRDRVARSPYVDVKDPPQLQLRHDMVRAKISGYTEPLATVLKRYPLTDNSSPARYARAIARFCAGQFEAGRQDIDSLLREQPQNPFLHYTKGDLLLRSGKPREAIAPLREAVRLKGDAVLIPVRLAHALLASEDPAFVDEALNLARGALKAEEIALGIEEGQNWFAYWQLATAYGKKGLLAEAELASAQSYFYKGGEHSLKEAKNLARRAQAKFPKDSREWRKAEAIINYKPPTVR
jgi:predicted Zn-dependent protease